MTEINKQPTVQQAKILELYVHIPFCVKKCDYCDFLSFSSDRKGREAYVQALCREIRAQGPSFTGSVVTTIFIGGGTPTILEPDLMEQVLAALHENFSFAENPEFTIEGNPGTLTGEKLHLYRRYGINRLSLGLQSTFDDDLKMLGRIHTYAQFETSYNLAREAGFANINVDLISAIPGQTRERWEENLRRAAALKPEHISAYSLIVEEETPFYERDLDLPDEETEYAMYEDTGAILKSLGYGQYEISNYAKDGYACRHNIGYWRRTDYLGLGLGASSLIHKTRFSNTADFPLYLKNAEDPSIIRKDVQQLSEQEEMEEFMFLGLRMCEGVSETEFKQQFNADLTDIYGEVLSRYERSGHLIHKDGRWRFSREGIHVSNWILSDFLQE